MNRSRVAIYWMAIAILVAVPIGAAAMSPLLEWREPIYIVAGFAGVVAMTLMLFQPLLAAGYLPGISALRGRQLHRWIGSALLVSVIVHIAGLWITSPPDVIDALLFVSPTAFSVWGVMAMWALFITAGLALCRRKLRLTLRTWRYTHGALAVVITIGSVVHAIKIEGTMETLSKSVLCVVLICATAMVLGKIVLRK